MSRRETRISDPWKVTLEAYLQLEVSPEQNAVSSV